MSRHNNLPRRALTALLALLLLLPLTACGSNEGYGIKAVQTLVEQEYSMAFRNNDPIIYYVVAAIKVLAAQGRIDELAAKWFGTASAVTFERDAAALDNLAVPENKTFIVGVDANSFPMVYSSNGTLWGFDIEMAIAVTELLGWTLKLRSSKRKRSTMSWRPAILTVPGAALLSIPKTSPPGVLSNMGRISKIPSSSPRETALSRAT